MRVSISPSSGKRPRDFFEKISSFSRVTSNTPPPLEMSSIAAAAYLAFKCCSKLEALGR